MQERRSTALGWLETAVLDELWTHGSADVAAMHARVGEPRGLARNTIQSTLERLYRKGLAERRKLGRAFEYSARISRGEWLTSSLGGVFETLPGADAARRRSPRAAASGGSHRPRPPWCWSTRCTMRPSTCSCWSCARSSSAQENRSSIGFVSSVNRSLVGLARPA